MPIEPSVPCGQCGRYPTTNGQCFDCWQKYEAPKYQDGPDDDDYENDPVIQANVRMSLGQQLRPCTWHHGPIATLHGLDPVPVSQLPKKCLCGRPVTYVPGGPIFVSRPTVSWHPSDPIQEREVTREPEIDEETKV